MSVDHQPLHARAQFFLHTRISSRDWNAALIISKQLFTQYNSTISECLKTTKRYFIQNLTLQNALILFGQWLLFKCLHGCFQHTSHRTWSAFHAVYSNIDAVNSRYFSATSRCVCIKRAPKMLWKYSECDYFDTTWCQQRIFTSINFPRIRLA